MGVLTPNDITQVAEMTSEMVANRVIEAIQSELTSLEDWCAGNPTRRQYTIRKTGMADYYVEVFGEKGHVGYHGPSVRSAADQALKQVGYVPLQ